MSCHACCRQRGTGTQGSMFLPQRPYMVLGTLRDQLLYPRGEHRQLPLMLQLAPPAPLFCSAVRIQDDILCRKAAPSAALP